MRAALLALLTLISACATPGSSVLYTLDPVIANSRPYDGRYFEGAVWVFESPSNYLTVSPTRDGAVRIELSRFSANRLYNYYQLREGHHVRIRAQILEERIIVTENTTQAACQYGGTTFYLTNVRVLQHLP
jgi:hypothetical protein